MIQYHCFFMRLLKINPTETFQFTWVRNIFSIKRAQDGAGGVTPVVSQLQWYHAYLASVKPCVQTPVPPKKKSRCQKSPRRHYYKRYNLRGWLVNYHGTFWSRCTVYIWSSVVKTLNVTSEKIRLGVVKGNAWNKISCNLRTAQLGDGDRDHHNIFFCIMELLHNKLN
jgi:hypothetical protein